MNQKTPFMWLFILILLAFVAGRVHISRLNSHNSSALSAHKQKSYHTAPIKQTTVSDMDFTDMLDEDLPPSKPAAKRLRRTNSSRPGPSAQQKIIPSVPSYKIPQQTLSNSAPSVHVFPSQTTTMPHSSTRVNTAKNYPFRRQAAFSDSGSDYRKAREESLLDHYLSRQTATERNALDQKVNQFMSALDQAIAKALMAKGKRAENIEKYLGRREGKEATVAAGTDSIGSSMEAASSIPSAVENIRRQIASQTKAIISDMDKNYGSSVAVKAKRLMNDFQKEMTDLLNSNMDPMEKQLAAKRLNNEYNQKLRQLNKEASTAKIKEQLRAENEEYLKKFSDIYGPQLAAEMRPALDEYAEKQTKLLTTPMKEEDFLKQRTELENKLRKAQEDILKKTNAGTAGDLTLLSNEQMRSLINNTKEDRSATYFAPEAKEQEVILTKQTEEKESILEGFQDPAIRAKAEQHLNEYYAKLADLSKNNNGKKTKLQQAKEELNLADQYNAILQQDRVEQRNAISEQMYKNYPDYMQDDLKEIYSYFNEQRQALYAIAQSNEEREKILKQLNAQEAKEVRALEEKYLSQSAEQ